MNELSFHAHTDSGDADEAYAVVTSVPGRISVVGHVYRYGAEWFATDRHGSWVATGSSRREVVGELVRLIPS